MNALSIIVPTLNEVDNIELLVERIAKTFDGSKLHYEIIFVDDHSKDGTRNVIKELSGTHPITFATKVGPRGKAHSLMQGFAMARHDVVCMIDADLQYPPEAIVPMFHFMRDNGVDIILTDRQDHETSALRQLSSKVFNFVFTRLLFGFDYDSQSGLKVFKKSILKQISINPTPWSFDLEFIVRSLEKEFKILSYQIPFSKRHSGEAKVRILKVTYELARASLKLRMSTSVSKVRQTYQVNARLNARAVSLLFVPVFALSLLASISWPAKASALSLPLLDQTTHFVSNQLDSINSALQPKKNQPTASPNLPASPVAASSPQLQASGKATSPANAPASSAQSAQPQSPVGSAPKKASGAAATKPQPAQKIASAKVKATFSKPSANQQSLYSQPTSSSELRNAIVPLLVVILGAAAVISLLLASQSNKPTTRALRKRSSANA